MLDVDVFFVRFSGVLVMLVVFIVVPISMLASTIRYLLNTFNVHDGFEIISYIVKQLVEVNTLPHTEIYTIRARCYRVQHTSKCVCFCINTNAWQ